MKLRVEDCVYRLCLVLLVAAAFFAGTTRAVEVKVINPLATVYDADRVIEPVTENTDTVNKLKSLDQFDTLYKSLAEIADEGVMRMVGPRNGRCSSQVVVWGEGAADVKVSLDDLRADAGAIPADAVLIRYAANMGLDAVQNVRAQKHPDNHFFNRWYNVSYCDVLDVAPKPGATVVPVWLTVQIPETAAPGLYKGTLTVGPKKVPVELTVSPWVCPSPDEFTVQMHMLQSPETLAAHYGVPMWSDEHMKLVDASLHYLGLLGNRSVVVTAQHHTHLGNESALVPFRAKNGRPEPDFTTMNRYLDAYAKNVRQPDFATLFMWSPQVGLSSRRRPDAKVLLTKIVDGKPQEWAVPLHDAASEPILSALLDGFRAQLAKRGWEDTQILIGLADDNVPDEKTTALFKRLAPWAKWSRFSHYRGDALPAKDDETYTLYGHMDIGYVEEPWLPGVPEGGWDIKFPRVTSMRRWITEYTPPTQFRNVPSVAVGSTRPRPYAQLAMLGVTRWGMDFWDVNDGAPLLLKYSYGRWSLMYRRVSVKKLLGPGRDGPVATVRLEMLLEGMQEAEARIAMEKASRRNDVPRQLKAQFSEILKRHVQFRSRNGKVYYGDDYKGEDRESEIYTRLWGVAADWRGHTRRLYDLAAQATPR